MHTLVSQVHAVLQDADPYVELQIDDEMRLDQVELRAFGDDKAAVAAAAAGMAAVRPAVTSGAWPTWGSVSQD